MSAKAAPARERLLEVARDMVRTKGFSATSVDDLCRAAGVTKGAFFHHFKTKEQLGVEVADYWSQTTSMLFAGAPYHRHADPFDRLIGYIEFRKQILVGDVAQFTCLVGTMVQEVYQTMPDIRAACDASITGHAMTLTEDIRLIMEDRQMSGFTPESLALHTQAVLQGAFILAKAKGSSAIAADSTDHLLRYIRLLFTLNPTHETV